MTTAACCQGCTPATSAASTSGDTSPACPTGAGEEEHVPPQPLKPPHDARTRGCQKAVTVQGRTARVAM